MIVNRKHLDIVSIILFIAIIMAGAFAAPLPPTIQHIKNETGPVTTATEFLNTTGGSITTIVLNASSQNLRWKAFVGNVTGTFTLDDAAGYTLFDWGTTAVTGQIYVTRSADALNWSAINCTWTVTGTTTNRAVEENENRIMNQTSANDNITVTFRQRVHTPFYVNERLISQDSCYAINTYVNSTAQSARFQEVILYDGTNTTNGDLVYAAILEQDQQGFDNDNYDFQMIVPENGAQGFQSSTAYYFYAELI
jgi:PBP1b-binding outer membrane lipoprotein LpoB